MMTKVAYFALHSCFSFLITKFYTNNENILYIPKDRRILVIFASKSQTNKQQLQQIYNEIIIFNKEKDIFIVGFSIEHGKHEHLSPSTRHPDKSNGKT